MKWEPGQRSDNIEDRRDESTPDDGGGGGGYSGGGLRLGLGGTVVVLLLSVAFRTNLFAVLGASPQIAPPPAPHAGPVGGGARRPQSGAEEHLVDFVSFVLDDVQHSWKAELPRQGGPAYSDAKLVLFRDRVRSGCGLAESAMGPFYCPADRKVYIDLGFYEELRTRFGAPGEFAEAYVIAHEVGHHVQNLLGIDERVRRQQQQDPRQQNHLSVRMELQADCFAGVWGHGAQARGILDPGDLESGLGAAAAVGDDRLEKQAGVAVNSEKWTHGSSRERVGWFRRGFTTGRLDACDTFQQPDPE